MLMEWTTHVRDEAEKLAFEARVRASGDVLQRLFDIANKLENQIDRTETTIAVYDTPNWEMRQAHKNGNRETLAYLKTLIKSAL